jgi:hypothetical protein
VCQAVRAPGVKWTAAAPIRDPLDGLAIVSTNTAPVNQSSGPRPVCMVFLVICIRTPFQAEAPIEQPGRLLLLL